MGNLKTTKEKHKNENEDFGSPSLLKNEFSMALFNLPIFKDSYDEVNIFHRLEEIKNETEKIKNSADVMVSTAIGTFFPTFCF